MAKRRKRTNSNVPAKGRLKSMADQLWSRIVREDWGNKCAMCGYGTVEAHHLIPRQHEATRYELKNGIALCASHHQFDRWKSPHQNAAGFMRWLETNHPNKHEWLVEIVANGKPQFEGTKTADYYCGILRGFRTYVEPDEFERICGVKFSQWLSEEE